MRGVHVAAAVLTLGVGALVAVELVPPAAPPPVAPSGSPAPPGETTCLVVRAPGQLYAPQDSTVTLLDGTRVGNADTLGGARAPLQVQVRDATLASAPLVAIGSREGLVWSECTPPSTDTYLQLPDVAGSDVVLVNPDSTDAVVNLTLHGAEGEVVESGARGIAVPRRSTRVVPMSVLAPSGSPVGVQVRTSQGRVQATARLTPAGGGADHATGQQPAGQVVVGGVPAGAQRVRLVLSNPGDQGTTVELTLLGARGSFAPVGAETVTLEPASSTVVDLTSAVAGDAVAVGVLADRGEVAASVHLTRGSDAALLPGTPVALPGQAVAGTSLVGYGPAGTLQVVNPDEDEVQVQVGGDLVTLAPRSLWTTPVLAGRHEVTLQVEAASGLVASVVSPQGAAARRLQRVGERAEVAEVVLDPLLR